MRIVILSAFYEPFMSGAEQLVKELSERIGETEEVVVLTARLQRSAVSREDRSNFILERLGVGHPWIDKFLFPLLAAWRVRHWQPDLVHAVMESYAGVALVGVKYFYPRARRLLTLQSGDLDDRRKQKQWHIRWAWRMIHQTPHHLTAISNFLADRAIKLGVPADHVSIIPNGVDLTSIPRPFRSNPNQIICVARLSWEKGLSDLLRAWKLVVAANPLVQLKIVGDGRNAQISRR